MTESGTHSTPFPTDTPVSVQPASSSAGPDDFEIDCINLLCKQENTLSMLGQTKGKWRVTESLELAKQMLIQFLDFADAQFSEQELGDIIKRLRNVYQRTKEHEKCVRNQPWNAVRRVFGQAGPSAMDLNQEYRQLCREYAQLYTDFFAICAARFRDGSAIREQFLESVEVFLAELDSKW